MHMTTGERSCYKKNFNDINVATSWVMLESNTKATITHNEIIAITARKTITTVIVTMSLSIPVKLVCDALFILFNK